MVDYIPISQLLRVRRNLDVADTQVTVLIYWESINV